MADNKANNGKQGRYLYLYLALACFLGIVIIFLFDGYLGVYDSLKADNGSYLQQVPTDQWQNPDRYGSGMSMGLDETGYLNFTYRVDNRRFTGYDEPVVVTVTDAGGTRREVLRENLTAGAFGSGEVTWTLQGTDVVPAGAAPNIAFTVHVTIQRGTVTRDIAIYVNRNAPIGKPVPSGAG